MSGTVHGVGLGPGSPDLMSVRADRLVRGARHVAYFRKAGRQGQARRIVEGMLRTDVVEFPMDYPVTTEIPLDDPRYAVSLAAFNTAPVVPPRRTTSNPSSSAGKRSRSGGSNDN